MSFAMKFDDALNMKDGIREKLTLDLRARCKLPGLRVSVSVSMDEHGEADYSVVLCDLTDPRRRITDEVLFMAKRKLQEICPASTPQIRAIMVPDIYLPETFIE
jgi:hypothetical protein